jgi:hypothetical protein
MIAKMGWYLTGCVATVIAIGGLLEIMAGPRANLWAGAGEVAASVVAVVYCSAQLRRYR